MDQVEFINIGEEKTEEDVSRDVESFEPEEIESKSESPPKKKSENRKTTRSKIVGKALDNVRKRKPTAKKSPSLPSSEDENRPISSRPRRQTTERIVYAPRDINYKKTPANRKWMMKCQECKVGLDSAHTWTHVWREHMEQQPLICAHCFKFTNLFPQQIRRHITKCHPGEEITFEDRKAQLQPQYRTMYRLCFPKEK